MAWRMVKQPNGLYTRFSDIVDNFTHINLPYDDAVRLCKHEGCADPATKVGAADENLHRWEESLRTIQNIHDEGGVEAVLNEINKEERK